jgi:hypothetical protein
MLENGLGLVGFYPFGHHVVDVHDDRGSQLQIVLRFNPLLGDTFCDAFGMSALKLSGKQVAEPSLDQRDDTSQEE